MIPNEKEWTYKQRLQNLKLSTLVYKRTRGVMIEAYKVLHNYDEEITPVINHNKAATSGNSLK